MTDPAPDRPSRARLALVGWLCGLAGLLYLDRVCLAQAVAPIQDELKLSNTEMSLVLMAFTLAYGLFAVPAGGWADRDGPRAVLARLVLAWSLFTALTGAATGLVFLVGVRFLFGAAEAGAFPSAAKVLVRWFPQGERGRAQGAMLAAGQVGAVAAPAASAYLIAAAGWRWVFVVYGLLGVVWAVGFWLWFRDDPAGHPAVNAAELRAIRADAENQPAADPGPVPWGAVLTNYGVIILGLVMTLASFTTYFFYSWFPKYLQVARGVSNVEAGQLASLVIAGSAVGMLLGGWVSDRLSRRASDPVATRRRVCAGCYLVAAGCLWLGVRVDDPLALSALWAMAFWALHVTLPNWWVLAIPQAGRHTATLTGLMNGLGVFGALASQGFVGWFADRQEKVYNLTGRAAWDPIFDVYVGALLAAAAGWWLYRFTPLVEPAAAGP